MRSADGHMHNKSVLRSKYSFIVLTSAICMQPRLWQNGIVVYTLNAVAVETESTGYRVATRVLRSCVAACQTVSI